MTRLVSPPDHRTPARFHPWAVGYASSPTPVGVGTWTRWEEDIEAYASDRGLPLLRVLIDDPPRTGQNCGDGFAELVQFLRERAHLRAGHVGVVLVPTIEHLSPGRDGSEGIVQQLLRLHFGIDVQATGVAPGRSDGRRRSGVGARARDRHPTSPGDFAAVLFGTNPIRLPGDKP